MQVLSKAINNARKNNDCDLIGGATSSKVIQEMYAFDIIKTKDEIKAFLEPHHSEIKAWVVDSYALEPVWKTFAIEEFVEYIIQDTGTIIA